MEIDKERRFLFILFLVCVCVCVYPDSRLNVHPLFVSKSWVGMVGNAGVTFDFLISLDAAFVYSGFGCVVGDYVSSKLVGFLNWCLHGLF